MNVRTRPPDFANGVYLGMASKAQPQCLRMVIAQLLCLLTHDVVLATPVLLNRVSTVARDQVFVTGFLNAFIVESNVLLLAFVLPLPTVFHGDHVLEG